MVHLKKFRVSVGAIVKDEAFYIEEWIVYHRLIGVEHFFILDHGSTDETRAILAPYVNRGLVTLIDWPMVQGQLDGYAFIIRLAVGMTDWMAIIDMDEFIRLNGPEDLPSFLAGVDADQVLCRWQFFGHSGHRDRPEGLVVENYVMAQDDHADMVKSIFRPETVVRPGVHVQTTVAGRTQLAGGIRALEGWRVNHRRGGNPVQVNHYYSRSWAEYEHKMRRGDALRNREQQPRTFEYFDYSHRDEALVRFGPLIRAQMAAMQDLPTDCAIYGSLASGVLSSCQSTFNYSVRDWMLDLAERLGSAEEPAGTFRKSDRGARMLMGDGADAAAVADALPGLGGHLAAAPLGPVDASPSRTHDLPHEEFTGFVFAAFLVRASGPGRIAVRATGRAGGARIEEEAQITVASPGLWLAVQVVNATPVIPDTVALAQPAEPTLDILATGAWFVS